MATCESLPLAATAQDEADANYNRRVVNNKNTTINKISTTTDSEDGQIYTMKKFKKKVAIIVTIGVILAVNAMFITLLYTKDNQLSPSKFQQTDQIPMFKNIPHLQSLLNVNCSQSNKSRNNIWSSLFNGVFGNTVNYEVLLNSLLCNKE